MPRTAGPAGGWGAGSRCLRVTSGGWLRWEVGGVGGVGGGGGSSAGEVGAGAHRVKTAEQAGAVSLTDGLWHHVALLYEHTGGRFRLLVDGAPQVANRAEVAAAAARKRNAPAATQRQYDAAAARVLANVLAHRPPVSFRQDPGPDPQPPQYALKVGYGAADYPSPSFFSGTIGFLRYWPVALTDRQLRVDAASISMLTNGWHLILASNAGGTASTRLRITAAPAPTAAPTAAPTKRPTPPMLANACGNATNSAPIVLSPTVPWSPKAKISGKIIRPARNATPKSALAMIPVSVGRSLSRPR